MGTSGQLILEDGRRFSGKSIGASGVSLGEVVFNTSMSGYQEVLTDPSYAGQIVTMTAPMIGNYGVNADDDESSRPQVAGFVVRELSAAWSGWRGNESLDSYLAKSGVVGLSEVDTRAVTRHVRTEGAMRAGIASGEFDPDELLARIRDHPRMEGLDLTDRVSTAEPYRSEPAGKPDFHVAAYDFGLKANSLRLLKERGCRVTTLPASTPVSEILDFAPDGLFVSNGPGDPDAVGHALDAIRTAAEKRIPVFGICLGHQLVARAFGGSTYKLLYGHRGGNHPVRRLADGAVEITAQNHGFAVRGDEDGGIENAPELRVTHVNLNDGTVEGLEHARLPVFSVQYHPEAAPGPHDSRYLFDRFIVAMRDAADPA